MKGRWLVLLLFFAGAASAVAEVETSSLHNAAIAPLIMGAKNACNAAERQPGLDDPFSVAEVMIVSLIPQVDGRTSDLSDASLLWSWSADYPTSASFALAGSSNCPAGEYRIRSLGGAALSGAVLSYTYGGAEKAIALGGAGPNPVRLELENVSLRNEDFDSPFARLAARISGTISVPYSFTKSVYVYRCAQFGEITACGCELETSTGTRIYEKQVSDAKNFTVETGPVQELWLNPPLAARLEGSQSGQALFFARRMPAKISVSVDGKGIGENAPYAFAVKRGECGEEAVSSTLAPHPENMEISTSNRTVAPFQLVEKNASYYPFYAEFGWNESSGKKLARLLWEDQFSHNFSFERNFSVRRPERYAGEGNGADGTGSGAEGGGSLFYRKGDESRTPAAYPTPDKAGIAPDYSPLAAVFALPAAFGAYSLLRRAGSQ